MHKTWYFTICVVLVAAAVATAVVPAGAAEDKAAADVQQRELIAVLQSDAPKADKAITCKRLAVYGTADAVPALAPLLTDKELASWARIALEAIPDPAADAALRDAMGKVQGRLLVGVINSIGVRRDAGAVDGLAQRLKDTDADVASAAAVAMGRIGNPVATKILEESLAGAPAAVRSAVAEGCILCAERLLADGKAADAAKLYDQVRKADVAKQRVLEATRGAILARQAAGIPLLVEQLKSDDKGMFGIALTTARELPGRAATEALMAALEGVAPERRALLIFALADRDDPAVLPAVLEAAKAGPNEVRIVAIGALARVGNASCVPALLDAAIEADADLAEAAKVALEGVPGKEVDADLAARLPKAEGKVRVALIEIAGRRRIDAATPALLKAADDPDAQVRAAALIALGSTVGPSDLAVLIARVVTPQKPEDAETAAQALRAACIRMADREACAGQLVAAMSQAPAAAKTTILGTLGAMGGEKALATVGAAAKGADPELQDAASRLLGEWMTVDAAPVLLDLAKTGETKYKVRALRGYVRIVRQFDIPDQDRAAMCRAALKAAERDAEKKLVLDVMERYPSVDMLKLAVDAAKVPAMKNDAARVSLAIAQKIGGNADVQKLLAQVGHEPVKVEIVKAEYGAGTKFKDVTAALRQHVRGFPLIVLPSSSYNSAFGGDPAPGVVKQLKVQYRINDRPGEASFEENATILLPIPK